MRTTTTRSARRVSALTTSALLIAVALAVTGCGGEKGSGGDAIKDGKQGEPAAGVPKESKQAGTAAGGASARMTRQEFRERMKTLPAAGLGWKNWDGRNRGEFENVGCPLLVSDLTTTFGEPAGKATRGKVMNWDWRCKDGGVRVVASQEWSNKDLFGPDNKVKHRPGEYLSVLAVDDN